MVHGWYFYSTTTIRQSYYGILHTFISGSSITNAERVPSGQSLRVLFAYWVKWYFGSHNGRERNPGRKEELGDEDLRELYSLFIERPVAHVPDILTMKGLLDMVSVGNILQLSGIIDPRAYAEGIPLPEVAQQQFGVEFYNDFVSGFSRDYTISWSGGEVDVDRSRVFFQVSVYQVPRLTHQSWDTELHPRFVHYTGVLCVPRRPAAGST